MRFGRKRNNEEKSVEPYAPDYSPGINPYQPPPQPRRRGGIGFFGCSLGSVFIIAISSLLLIALIGGLWIMSIQTTGDATASIFDSIGNIFGGGDNITVVDVRQVILAVRQEAWLETVRESQALDVYASSEMPGILPGRRSMRYQAFVTVTAGVDLELMSEENFVVDGASVTVILPQAQLKDCILDTESSRYYDRSCFNVGCGNLEEVLVERALETAATQETDRLLQDATDNAAEYIANLSRTFGFEDVLVQQSQEPLSPVALGGTCEPHIPPPATPTPTPEG